MTEREWQPGASERADERGDHRASDADADAGRTIEGATDDARNVEGVQGAQGGVEEPARDQRPP